MTTENRKQKELFAEAFVKAENCCGFTEDGGCCRGIICGDLENLLAGYTTISIELFKRCTEELGKNHAMALYAIAQNLIIEKIDPDGWQEAERLADEVIKSEIPSVEEQCAAIEAAIRKMRGES